MSTLPATWQGFLVLEEDDEPGWFSLILLADAIRRATRSGLDRALVNGRAWSLTALSSADDQWRSHGLVELPTCANCSDAPGTEPMGDGRTYCRDCNAATAGSHYDDTSEDYR